LADVEKPDPISWLVNNPANWPKEVTLVREIEFPVMDEGRRIGYAKAPVGSVLPVTGVAREGLTATYGGKTHAVPLDATDIARRAEAAMQREKERLASAPAATLPQATPAPTPKKAEIAEPEEADGKQSQNLYPERYLKAVGNEIRNPVGETVVLRGVNVGGWLVTEGWMCGEPETNDRKLIERLEARFGEEQAAELMKVWYDHWFTAEDLDVIKSYGFNLIRVPFSWRNLQNAKGEWIRNEKGQIDFSRFDWVVNEAAKRGIYVMFDLHTWPGSAYGVISRHTDEGREVRKKMSKLWKTFARHFRGNGNIAGFDVINEPEGSPGDAPQREFYDAIRAADSRRMLIMEWTALRHWNSYGWENVVWSDHYPEDRVKEIPSENVEERIAAFEEKEITSQIGDMNFPVFIGELKAPQDTEESARALVEAFDKRGWSWAVWTYKGVNVGGWASVNYDKALYFDYSADSYEEIMTKWSDGLSRWRDPSLETNLSPKQWWIDGYSVK